MLTLGPRSSWIQLAVLLAVLALLLQTNQYGDWLVRTAIWTAVVAASIYSIVRAFRGHGHTTDPTVGLPAGLRRWLIGESKRP
jgi:hypothetical protein